MCGGERFRIVLFVCIVCVTPRGVEVDAVILADHFVVEEHGRCRSTCGCISGRNESRWVLDDFESFGLFGAEEFPTVLQIVFQRVAGYLFALGISALFGVELRYTEE